MLDIPESYVKGSMSRPTMYDHYFTSTIQRR